MDNEQKRKEALKSVIKDLTAHKHEEEWFEFKVNWNEHRALGEYISAMSNVAAILGEENAYFVWGIENNTHRVVGTDFDIHQDVKNEPLQHYLARLVRPDIGFYFDEIVYRGKRLVVLTIPADSKTPTAFDKDRFIRIGSSKANLTDYPEHESKLFEVLRNGQPTIENTESEYQDLTFDKLFMYYTTKKVPINKKSFKKNLGLLTKDGKYNLMAQLLSDNSHIPIRFSIYGDTKKKASSMYTVREFGNDCLLLSVDNILNFGNLLNIPQVDEANRQTTRIEVPLFNKDAYREAVINALLHNRWISYNAPMFTAYSDRVEILSRGTLPPGQTMEGFFLGESVPVNQKLSDIFLQLHISERSGQGVPSIVDVYGREVYEFRENSIVASIPYERLETAWTTSKKSSIEIEEPDSGNEKLAIGNEKPSFERQKLAIERIYELCKGRNYSRPTMDSILKVYENTEVDGIVSAPDVQRITQCSVSTSKNIMNKLKDIGVLVVVNGHGKGKYRFKYNTEE